jgi:histidine ammonia-lyase
MALAGLFAAERAIAAAFVAGALSVDACLGSDTPFDPRIHAVRGHRGQADAAAIYRRSCRGSAIRESH